MDLAVLAFLLSLLLGISESHPTHSPPKEKLLQSVCGRPKIQPKGRIVGGQDAAEGHWPWQASVHLGQTQICGGSLITESWILTAAHCVTDTWSIFPYTVQLGSIYRGYSNSGEEYYVSRIITHPTFDTTIGDIALLKLDSQVTFTSLILPICLPIIKENLTVPDTCWVTGWGETKRVNGTNLASTLQEAEVPVIDHKTCDRVYDPAGIYLPGRKPIVQEDKICAGNTRSIKKDSCQGDSGGPLSCLIDDVWIQTGVVSWGIGCADDFPGVYTSVIYYQKWINATISRAEVLHPQNLNLSDFLLLTVLLSLTVLLGPSCALWV